MANFKDILEGVEGAFSEYSVLRNIVDTLSLQAAGARWWGRGRGWRTSGSRLQPLSSSSSSVMVSSGVYCGVSSVVWSLLTLLIDLLPPPAPALACVWLRLSGLTLTCNCPPLWLTAE